MVVGLQQAHLLIKPFKKLKTRKDNFHFLYTITSLIMSEQIDNSLSYLLIGTYTQGKSEGIYVYQFNKVTGEAQYICNTQGVENPSYISISADNKFVFAVNESGNKEGDFVSAFKFNIQNGELEFINKVPSGGIDPCYVSVDENNNHLFIANYSSGSLAVISIDKAGRLSDAIQLFNLKGKSIHPDRQKQSHLHSSVISPEKEILFVSDLGADKIYSYSYHTNSLKEPLQQIPDLETNLEKGDGPRHLAFSKNGRFAYLSLELNASIAVFNYQNNILSKIQNVKMTDDNFTGIVSGADIHLSADGKFLYASNRGDANQLVVFAINAEDGKLQFVERVSCMGQTPRNFVIDPSDNFLIVANQNSNNCFIFRRDKLTGKLKYTGNKIVVEAPVCLKMI